MPLGSLRASLFDWIVYLPRLIFRHRALVSVLVLRDLKLRYKGSALGFLWSFANPLLLLVIYILVFSVYMRIDAPNYPAYLISGLFPWICFTLSVQSGTNAIVDGGGYITQAVFPSEILPVISVVANIANFLLSIPIMVIAILALGLPLGLPLVALPVIIAVQFLFTIGIVFFLATYNVYFRDVGYLVANLLTLVFFLVPIIYPPNLVPSSLTVILKWNVLAWIIEAYQDVFFRNRFPNWEVLGAATIFSLVCIVAGHWVFQRNKESFAEYF